MKTAPFLLALACLCSPLCAEPSEMSLGGDGTNSTRITSSGPADIDWGARKFVFSDDVKVKSPDFDLTCQELVAYLHKNTNTLERIESRGKVRLSQKDQSGEGDELVYTMDDAKMVFIGHAKVNQKGNTVEGQRIELFRTNNLLRVFGGPSMFLPNGGAGLSDGKEKKSEKDKPSASATKPAAR
jgi:lipopolysaccharide transport protein LptA